MQQDSLFKNHVVLFQVITSNFKFIDLFFIFSINPIHLSDLKSDTDVCEF